MYGRLRPVDLRSCGGATARAFRSTRSMEVARVNSGHSARRWVIVHAESQENGDREIMEGSY